MDSHPFSPFEVPFLGIPCETPFEPHRNTHQLPLATIPPGNAASIAFRFSSIFFSLSSCNWCLRKETHPGEYQGLNPNKQLQMNAPKKTHGTYMKLSFVYQSLIASYWFLLHLFRFWRSKKKITKIRGGELVYKRDGKKLTSFSPQVWLLNCCHGTRYDTFTANLLIV